MYWRLESLPELEHFSDDERSQMLRRYTGKWFSMRLFLGCILRAFSIAFIVVVVAVPYIFKQTPLPSFAPGSLIFALVPFVGLIISAGIYQYRLIQIRGQLRLYLEELKAQGQRLPVCIKCGYAISQQFNRCPECGTTT